jgi:hypothetical protein
MTDVPLPGEDQICAEPPTRLVLASTEFLRPSLSGAVAAASKPTPSSMIITVRSTPSPYTTTSARSVPLCTATLARHWATARPRARQTAGASRVTEPRSPVTPTSSPPSRARATAWPSSDVVQSPGPVVGEAGAGALVSSTSHSWPTSTSRSVAIDAAVAGSSGPGPPAVMEARWFSTVSCSSADACCSTSWRMACFCWSKAARCRLGWARPTRPRASRDDVAVTDTRSHAKRTATSRRGVAPVCHVASCVTSSPRAKPAVAQSRLPRERSPLPPTMTRAIFGRESEKASDAWTAGI